MQKLSPLSFARISPLFRRGSKAGFKLVEVLVALNVLLIAITGVAALNSSALALTRSAKQTAVASLCLQERVEQLRLANWQQVTDATYLRDTVYAVTPRNMAGIARATETLTISAYPDASVTDPIRIRKTAHATTVLSAGPGLKNQPLVTLAMQVQWEGRDGRLSTRESVTIVSRDGVSKLNLAYPEESIPSGPTQPQYTQPGKSGQGRGNAGGKPGTK